jgi:hypothetical protein
MPSQDRTNQPPKTRPVVGAPQVRESRATKRPVLPLPHDRDESTPGKGHEADAVIDQAREDLEQGKEDTDLRGEAGKAFERRWGGSGDRNPKGGRG